MSHITKSIICPTCQTPFEIRGNKKKYCSRTCSSASPTNKQSNYKAQQSRGLKNKIALVERAGGRCSTCGYDKNFSALCFHHIEESTKTFGIDIRKCSNTTWKDLCEEADKCKLLCANCHSETHYPHLEKSLLSDVLKSPALPTELQSQI